MLEHEGRSGAAIQQKSFDAPDDVRRFPKGIVNLVHIGSVTMGRGILEPGFRWSTSLRAIGGDADDHARSASGRDASVVASMRAASRPAGHHLVALGDLVLHDCYILYGVIPHTGFPVERQDRYMGSDKGSPVRCATS